MFFNLNVGIRLGQAPRKDSFVLHIVAGMFLQLSFPRRAYPLTLTISFCLD